MSLSYEPKTPFEGYVVAKLEGLDKKFDSLDCSKHIDRIDKVENKLSNIEGKATVFGIIGGFIISVLTKLFTGSN